MDVLICSRTESVSLLIKYWRFLFLTLFQVRLVLLACLYLNLSKNSSLTAFFRKADAKVRLFFEPPKLFQVFFWKFCFSKAEVRFSSSLFQHFNFIAFPSRKRMQNYCFTTYPPNLLTNFFALFCNFSANSLICRCVLRHDFYCTFQGTDLLHLNIITRAYIRTHIYG